MKNTTLGRGLSLYDLPLPQKGIPSMLTSHEYLYDHPFGCKCSKCTEFESALGLDEEYDDGPLRVPCIDCGKMIIETEGVEIQCIACYRQMVAEREGLR